jgi:hypothetical protein
MVHKAAQLLLDAVPLPQRRVLTRLASRRRLDARARRRWIRERGMLDPARLVLIDETAVSTNSVRLRGRAPRGARVIGTVPLASRETITFVAAPAPQQNDRANGRNGQLSGPPRRHSGGYRAKRGRQSATRRSTRLTSIRSSCLAANSKRSCAKSPREPFSGPQTSHSLGHTTSQPQECANYFRHAGSRQAPRSLWPFSVHQNMFSVPPGSESWGPYPCLLGSRRANSVMRRQKHPHTSRMSRTSQRDEASGSRWWRLAALASAGPRFTERSLHCKQVFF